MKPQKLFGKGKPIRHFLLRDRLATASRITEDQIGGITVYTVAWTDGTKRFVIKAPSPPIAQFHAGFRAQMLYVKAC